MTESKLIGKRIVEIVPGRKMVLEYFIIKNFDESSQTISYGAKIHKTEEESSETEIINGIIDSEEVILDVVNMLLEHTVTPVSMVNVIDDYVTEKVCG